MQAVRSNRRREVPRGAESSGLTNVSTLHGS